MGRKRNWPPRINSHKGQARVWWNGQWWPLGKDGSAESLKEHRRLLSIWAVDPFAVPETPDDLLVAELLRDWLASDAAPKGDHRSAAVRAVTLLLEFHEETTVEKFGPVALRAWQTWLCRQCDQPPLLTAGRPLWNRTYIAALVRWIRQAFKWGVASERIEYSRYEALRTIAPPKFEQCREPEPVRAVDPDVVKRTLPHLRPPVRAMVKLQQLTGARPEEVCQLTPAMIHRKGKLDVPGVGIVNLDVEGVWVYLPAKWKTRHRRKPRWLVLGKRAQRLLRPYLERNADSPCFSPAESLADLHREQVAERLAHGGGSGGNRKVRARKPKLRPGERYTPRTYLQAVARGAKRAGVPHWTPYSLRHLHALTVDANLGLDHAQASMGHTDPDVTRRYAKRSFRAAAEVAKKMG